jgi:iron(III) transport system substrate-binding protein
VFWNNEILNTLRLRREGLLTAYPSPAAEDFPEQFRSPDHCWHGFASRARVLIVNTDLVEPENYPTSIHDLADPTWKGQVGIAKPLFGTTASHAACLFAYWGEEKAKQFFRGVRKNARVMSGNKSVALAVSGGALAFGLTDTDDAVIEVERGRPVTIVYPDQEPRGAEGDEPLGTLFIPNTLAIIRGGPNAQAARKLVDFLLQPEVEKQLAEGISAQIPLNPNVEAKVRVETPRTIQAMSVDFNEAAEHWDAAAEFLRNEFGQ